MVYGWWGFPSGEGIKGCVSGIHFCIRGWILTHPLPPLKRGVSLLIVILSGMQQSEKSRMHSAALPLMKGARGMLILYSFICIVYASKANETSPYPLRKGDFFLLVILNGVKNLECIAQPSPLEGG